ncbi:MAG: hypothetical protein GC165_04005 [Armatimonadetes bacterium]|nr:hypothetical protein [Armatimonadota bacterium]
MMRTIVGTVATLMMVSISMAQRPNQKPSADDVGFAHGTFRIETPSLSLEFIKDSQTLLSLHPKSTSGFDFLPTDRQQFRNANGYYQFGDLNLRLRKAGESDWKSYSTATHRAPVTLLKSTPQASTADLRATFPGDFPLQVNRTWSVDNGHLKLTFSIKNPTKDTIEVGSLGIPMILNNIISDRNLKEAHERCSFSDPYIGRDAGYVQVTRLSGEGPALVITPQSGSPLEAYHLLNEPTRPNQTFEGMFEWMVHSKAYADNEWKEAEQWNPPTEASVGAGETKTYGLEFLVSPSIRGIEKTLADNHKPVTVGIPGYILPIDQHGKLFVKYDKAIKSLEVEPKGAMLVSKAGSAKNGYKTLSVNGKGWGRARLTITYTDGVHQTIHYYLTKPAQQVVKDMGHFLSTKQYFTDMDDPFHRAPSFISYDRDADKQVTQDSRVWIAGLGDEGGSGSFVAEAMKLFGQPTKDEVGKFEDFVDGVLWGNIQFKDGPNKYGVRKSVFFYEPALVPDFKYNPNFNWTSWTSWNKKASEDIGRGYNYPHTVASYWAMYRVARNHPGLATHHDWQWYLNQAYETTMFMTSKDKDGNPRVWYVDLGLMEGTIFIDLLKDLKNEGWADQAKQMEARMKARADHWIAEEYPFGSEMAWDSTGQEEVYGWCKYFGRNDKAMVSLNSIIGYMPSLPHWGYNGNARRYWDFLYGGKLPRIERQLHHYGSGLNAIPMLTEYREHPDDYHLLFAGYGGAMGSLSNISKEGCASVAFHSFPSTLKWDAYTGDYGPNFLGHSLNAATYLIDHPDFGWQAFGGNVSVAGSKVSILPLDCYRRQFYIAPAGLWLTLDAGSFVSVEYDTKTRAVRVAVSGDANTPNARLRFDQPAKMAGVGHYAIEGSYTTDAGATTIPMVAGRTRWIELKQGV